MSLPPLPDVFIKIDSILERNECPLEEKEFQVLCLEALNWIGRELNCASENVRGCGERLMRIEEKVGTSRKS